MKNNLLQEQLAKKILILDGAMGTMLQHMGLKAEDFGGEDKEGCNEILNLTRPDIVKSIHESYLRAGADIIETNTFGATRVVLAEYGLADKDMEINKAAAELACKVAARWCSWQQPRFVAGSMGPTIKMLSLTGGITFAELEEAYYRQALGLLRGGVDLLLLETCQDTLNVKAAGIGINRAFSQLGFRVPLIISCTVEASGTMLGGQNVEAFYVSVAHLKPLAIGLNCGTGAELMNDSLRTLHNLASCAVCCYPNAGLPDEEGKYRETPEQFAAKMAKYAANGWLNIAGGCCGSTDRHIKALADVLAGYRPRKPAEDKDEKSCVAGLEAVWPEEDNRPLLVGERCNVIGSRKFKEIISNGRYEEGAELAKIQVKKGAQIIDICLANPDSDELQDMKAFLPHVVNRIRAPLMLDSTDSKVLEAGLALSQGKAIINSINLEYGLKRFEEVVPLIKKYGAAVVVGTIDEQGMALTRERKLAVAERSYDLLVNKYGISPYDIIFDPLTFPVGTGDSKYLGSAVETIEGLRLIKQKMPQCKTILGISNVSFGLPTAGREILNSVFVYLNTLAGLDYAIVNVEKLRRYATIPPEEKKLCEDLLLNTNQQTLKAFIDFYREKTAVATTVPEKDGGQSRLTLEERLSNYIVEGIKEGLADDLLEGLKTYSPLELINGPLLKGMEQVGELFQQNQLIVAEVLQSAEVMKAAVDILKPYMEKSSEAYKGKVILATVKGDVHDIGKNLVDIILSNNGYQVVNLGVKVSSEQLIEACRREKPDVIGLSGLLVKSVQQMLITAQDLRDAGFNIPLLLGGAALSRKFTEEKIAPEYKGPVLYARDAMESLTLLSKLRESGYLGQDRPTEYGDKPAGSRLEDGSLENQSLAKAKAPGSEETPSTRVATVSGREKGISESTRRLLLDYPLAKIIPHLNFDKLYRKYLGVKSNNQSVKVEQYKQFVDEFLEEVQSQKLISANGVYAFFPAYSSGGSIFILDPSGTLDANGQQRILEEFVFPRQKKGEGLCLADFVRPLSEGSPEQIAVFALTTGVGVSEKAEFYKQQGQYLKSIFLQALALELAEAFAEHLHAQVREIWGIPPTQGIRVSPGYPVFPAIEDQTKIFALLKPEEVGLTLTEGMMMDPEASVSGIILGASQARIFSLN